MTLGAVAVFAAACGHDDTFHVKGELDDGASINLRFIYYTNGGVASGITASNNGKFMFTGRSASPTLVEVYDNDYRLMGRFVARNGEDINLRLNRKNPYKNTASGNELSERMTAFLNANADKLVGEGRNDVVAAYVRANTSDPVSDILLVTEFDARGAEALADSLHGIIAEDARMNSVSGPAAAQLARVAANTRGSIEPVPYRVKGNREETFAARRRGLAMMAFDDGRAGRDSVVEALRSLARKERDGRFELIEFSMDADTSAWRRNVEPDSATWKQGWIPGAVTGRGVDRLGIPELPYFILVDSAGRQLWRGVSVKAAVARVTEALE